MATKPNNDELVSIFVPSDTGNNAPIEGNYNGENWRVPRNKWVKVKKPIAEIIEYTYDVMRSIEEAQKEFKLSN